MKPLAAIALSVATAAPAQAQAPSGWTIQERVLDDGARALVLSRPQGEARVEYRVRHLLRRGVARGTATCYSESSSTEMLTVAERLETARAEIEAALASGDCGVGADPNFLQGFDAAFQELEQRVARTSFPPVQAWERDAVCCTISRQHGFPIRIRFQMADLNGARQGEVEVAAWNPQCRRGQPFYAARAATTGDLPARIAAARAATEAQVRDALAACPVDGVTAETLMEGFDEALAAAEAQLAAEQARQR